jgi:ABC-type phosphate/phosphonate transport system substrate-binding protein
MSERIGSVASAHDPAVNLRFATFLAPCNRPLYEFVAARCGASELVEGGDWRELAGGSIDVAFVCSPPLIWLDGAVEAIAAPVLSDPAFGARPLYCSDVVVARDSPFQSLDDLRGRRWAINEPSSWSGFWVTLDRVGSWSFFSEVVTAGFHERALRMVAAGEVDGAAIDRHVMAVQLRIHPELGERLRVVETLGPAPSQPVVVRSELATGVKEELRSRLLGLRGSTMRDHFVDAFAPAPDYSAIAAVVGTAPY